MGLPRGHIILYDWSGAHTTGERFRATMALLLNLLDELGKRDKILELQSILSLFGKELNKVNNTGA